jgi:CheY-like chemotaxis protein
MKQIRLLLAEDDADDRFFFTDFARKRNDLFLLPVAQDGEEVLNALLPLTETGTLPNAILLDQNMPKRNGLQTLELLKSHTVYDGIPVFIYSTYADDFLRTKGLVAGAIAVFQKPYTVDGYNQMVNDIIDMIGFPSASFA